MRILASRRFGDCSEFFRDRRPLTYLPNRPLPPNATRRDLTRELTRDLTDANMPLGPSTVSTDNRLYLFPTRRGIWTVPECGGMPRQVLRFDDSLHPHAVNARNYAFNAGRLYFTLQVDSLTGVLVASHDTATSRPGSEFRAAFTAAMPPDGNFDRRRSSFGVVPHRARAGGRAAARHLPRRRA